MQLNVWLNMGAVEKEVNSHLFNFPVLQPVWLVAFCLPWPVLFLGLITLECDSYSHLALRVCLASKLL